MLKTDAPLVACAGEGVYVFSGDRDTCARMGMRPLPSDYTVARRRFNAFAREVMALEKRTDCLPPKELAARVQAILDRSGWDGWRAWLRLDVSNGPCGTISSLGGDGRRSVEGSLDADGRRVMIVGEAARSTMDLLYGPGGIGQQLYEAGCVTRPQVEEIVGDRALRIEGGERGCARVADVQPAADGYGIVVKLER